MDDCDGEYYEEEEEDEYDQHGADSEEEEDDKWISDHDYYEQRNIETQWHSLKTNTDPHNRWRQIIICRGLTKKAGIVKTTELLRVIKSFIKDHHRKQVFQEFSIAWTIGCLYDYVLPRVNGTNSELKAMYSLAREIVDLYKPIYEAERSIAVTPKSLAALNSHFQTSKDGAAYFLTKNTEVGNGEPVVRELEGDGRVIVEHLVDDKVKKLKVVDMKKVGMKAFEVWLPTSWLRSEYDD